MVPLADQEDTFSSDANLSLLLEHIFEMPWTLHHRQTDFLILLFLAILELFLLQFYPLFG
jgi:hypothetical protein